MMLITVYKDHWLLCGASFVRWSQRKQGNQLGSHAVCRVVSCTRVEVVSSWIQIHF